MTPSKETTLCVLVSSGDYVSDRPLDQSAFREMVRGAVESLDIERVREEVRPFVLDRQALEIWSRDFFDALIDKVELA